MVGRLAWSPEEKAALTIAVQEFTSRQSRHSGDTLASLARELSEKMPFKSTGRTVSSIANTAQRVMSDAGRRAPRGSQLEWFNCVLIEPGKEKMAKEIPTNDDGIQTEEPSESSDDNDLIGGDVSEGSASLQNTAVSCVVECSHTSSIVLQDELMTSQHAVVEETYERDAVTQTNEESQRCEFSSPTELIDRIHSGKISIPCLQSRLKRAIESRRISSTDFVMSHCDTQQATELERVAKMADENQLQMPQYGAYVTVVSSMTPEAARILSHMVGVLEVELVLQSGCPVPASEYCQLSTEGAYFHMDNDGAVVEAKTNAIIVSQVCKTCLLCA